VASAVQNADGKVDEKELHICLLTLYDKLNDKLPCHVTIPTTEQVHELFERHELSPGVMLGEEEFFKVASDLFASETRWYQSIPVKVCLTIGLQLALFPLIGASNFHSCMCLTSS
jgi:hypothetical protein